MYVTRSTGTSCVPNTLVGAMLLRCLGCRPIQVAGNCGWRSLVSCRRRTSLAIRLCKLAHSLRAALPTGLRIVGLWIWRRSMTITRSMTAPEWVRRSITLRTMARLLRSNGLPVATAGTTMVKRSMKHLRTICFRCSTSWLVRLRITHGLLP